MKVCVIFGGAGYIGAYLTRTFLEKNIFDKIIIADIVESNIKLKRVEYLYCDVRKNINILLPDNIGGGDSWVFNLAAIHREPGHQAYEYFNTNIKAAKNINDFLKVTGIQNLYFTSSIAPYGRSREMRDENSECYPETPYGISKWKAESIHEVWQKSDKNRRLIITRPSVIYGPGDPGNVLRMIRGIKKGSFFIPGDPTIIKSHGYIYGLIDSILFTMDKNDSFILYNYAENPCLSLGEMVDAVKYEFNIKRPVIRVPLFLLVFVSRIITFFYRKNPIHPVRVKKAAFPTNIKPSYLIENGFDFKYVFQKSLQHWNNDSPHDFD
jgi:nucleoside-diphosphate-sugar epimerase